MPTASKKIPAWSFSALTSFETCPKQFWHMRIKRDFKDEGNENSAFGTHVHDSIAQYFLKNKKLPLDISYIKPIIDVYKKAAFRETHIELKLAINQKYKPVAWMAPDVYCRAIVDAGFVQGPKALLVDWKTGKMKPDSEATQLRLSAVMFMLFEPDVNEVTMRYVWLMNNGKTTTFKMTRDDIPAVWNELAPRLRRYQHAHQHDEFPANPSGLCRKYCPITTCPYYGGS